MSQSLWTWGSSPKSNGFGKFDGEMQGSGVVGGGIASGSHCSTLERLHAWEKKLYQEVKVILVPHVLGNILFVAPCFASLCELVLELPLH